MLKRLTVAVAALFALVSQAFAAGTIPGFSLTPQFDLTGKVAPNCFLYVIQAGTVSTPQNAYQDSGLTILAPNPLRCDASGRLPQWFVADGTIKVRLTTSAGAQVFVGDGLLVVGSSSGGGGGSPVDPTTVIATGDVKVRYGTGVLTGFVRMNGRTIGSATSGATERANADAQALFEYLWGTDVNLTVSGGRGATANADWTANKTLTLPDLRGRTLWGLDDMGNTPAVRLSNTCPTPTVLGTACGSDGSLITQATLPVVTWPMTLGATLGSMGITDTIGVSSTLGISDTRTWQTAESAALRTFNGVNNDEAFGSGALQHSFINRTVNVASGSISLTGGVSKTGGVALTGAPTITGSVTSGGSGAVLPNLPPMVLMTFYCKL